MMLAETVQDQQRDADSKCAVGHIERGKRVEACRESPAEGQVIVHEQKIDDLAQGETIPEVAQGAAKDQAQRQAQMNEAARKEYARRAYLVQEALRQKAQTDPKAREAYQALGRVMMGR